MAGRTRPGGGPDDGAGLADASGPAAGPAGGSGAGPGTGRPARRALPVSARRIVAVVSAVVSVTLTVAGYVTYRQLPPGWAGDVPATPEMSVGVTFPLVGAFLLAHRSRPPTAWLMCLGGFGCAVSTFAGAMMLRSGADGAMQAAGYYRHVSGVGWIAGGILLATVLPLYSPDGRLPSRRWRPVAALAFTVMAAEAFRSITRPTPPLRNYPLPRIVPNPFAVEALAPHLEWMLLASTWAINVMAVLALASLAVRFRSGDPVLRRQIAWPLSTFGLYVVVLLGGPSWWLPATVLTGLIPVSIAFAVLRYRLYGIETVASRAFVAAGLIAAVSVVYFGAGAVAGLFLSDYAPVGGAIAALFAGAVFHPLRRVLRLWADRLLYGTRGDPRALTARLAAEAAQTEPVNALAAMAAVIRDVLSVTGVAVEVDGAEGRPAEIGLLGPAPRAVPLIWHGEPVGRLLLGSPGPRRFAAAHNDRLIAAATPYVADVVHAVRMTADLRRSRERILSAREEERRRLRRDLHDGLGHALTDMAMSINMARITLRTSPDSADLLLGELRGAMDTVSREVRELVYGLRPPTLDELGLAGAVRALAAEGDPEVSVETAGDLSDLPAAAEVAAYRIAQEALTNIRKHAGARTATVSLARGESLTVRVRDDGKGLPETARSGVGLLSMRERAAELGGTCVVGVAAGGGTVVEAVLPLPAGREPPAPAGRA